MQAPIAHTAVQCLTAIAQHHGLQVNPERLIADYALGAEEPNHLVMLRMAADIGFKAKLESMSWDGLLAQGGVFPLIAYTRVGTMVIVVGASLEGSKKIALLDPASPQAVVQLVDEQGFSDLCNGKVMLLKREHTLTDPDQKFGFAWFIPEIWKQKEAFRDIFIAAIAIQVLTAWIVSAPAAL